MVRNSAKCYKQTKYENNKITKNLSKKMISVILMKILIPVIPYKY